MQRKENEVDGCRPLRPAPVGIRAAVMVLALSPAWAVPIQVSAHASKASSHTASHVEYGKSECAYCRMIIFMKQFGGQFETTSGKTFAFDAIECLAASYCRNWNVPASEVKAIHFANYQKPGTLIAASKATLVRTRSVVSPMGLNIIALASRFTLCREKNEDKR